MNKPEICPSVGEWLNLLPADADTVTAIMLNNGIKVTLRSDGQFRVGQETIEGDANLFATTCAQINGL